MDKGKLILIATLLGIGVAGSVFRSITFYAGTWFCSAIIIAIFCSFISRWLEHVPESYRTITPIQIWLCVIPIIGFYWQFIVYIRVPKSFKKYFDDMEKRYCRKYEVGDCGANLGMWICYLTILNGFLTVFSIFFFPMASDLSPKFAGLAGLLGLVLLGLGVVSTLAWLILLILWIIRIRWLKNQVTKHLAG